jgi:hypothetical protein
MEGGKLLVIVPLMEVSCLFFGRGITGLTTLVWGVLKCSILTVLG